MSGVGVAPCRTVAAENIRHLDRWTRHEKARVRRAVSPR
jgi:hypothetical protein